MIIIENASPEKIKEELSINKILSPEKEKVSTPLKEPVATQTVPTPIPLNIPKTDLGSESSSKKIKMNRNSSMQEMNRNQNYQIAPEKRMKMLKNNSCRDIFDCNRTKKVSKNEEKQIINSMLERFDKYKVKYEEKNKQLKKQLEEKRMKEVKFKPKVNNYCSVGMDKIKKDNYLTRSTQFIQQKKKKTEQIMKERENKEKTYINPKLNKKAKLSEINEKLQTLFVWEETKKQKIENKKKETINKELSICTFKPEITKRSIKLAKNGFRLEYYNKPSKTEKKKKVPSKTQNSNDDDDVIAKAKLALEQSEIIQNSEKSEKTKEDVQKLRTPPVFVLEKTADINLSNNFNTLK